MADLIPQLFPEKEPVIRTLGLYQPFATLMLHNKLETRWVKTGRKPPFPHGRYLIYATKKQYTDQQFKEIAGVYADSLTMEIIKNDPAHKCLGQAIAIGDLVEVREMTAWDSAQAFVEFMTDPDYTLWALEFNNIKRIIPFTLKVEDGAGQGVNFYKGDPNKIKIIPC